MTAVPARSWDSAWPSQVPKHLRYPVQPAWWILARNLDRHANRVAIQVVDGGNTSTLLTENMDNFRDLDYHFVSPPVLTGNQKLQIQVNCPANNGAQATPPAPGRACNPSVLFSGFLSKGS